MSTGTILIIIIGMVLIPTVIFIFSWIIDTSKRSNCKYRYTIGIPESIDHRIMVNGFEDLLVLDKYHIRPFRGMIVFVQEGNELFQLKEPDYKRSDSWRRIN